jgi:aminocarboxymuconate-semialdehyde decarboxylase
MYFDSLVHDASKLNFLIDLVGADQIALGTDYPFPLGESEPGRLVDSCGFSAEIKAMLLHGAALNWLCLEESRFI